MNKLLKTLIAGVSALTMCISAMPLSASAATTSYKKGDVNGDGIVNSSDVLAIKKFLNGNLAAKDGAMAERLDVNLNGIVDQIDMSTIKNIVLGLEDEATLTSNDTSSVTSQDANRLYYVFDSNGNYIKKYTLQKVSNIASGASTRTIIGDDDRYVDNSLNGVVRFSYNNEGNGFTGFVVDKHTILTAAHCITQNSIACVPSYSYTIEFFDKNGSRDNSITATPVECHIPYQYIANQHADDNIYEKYDYALITVKEDLSKYMCFNLGVARSNIRRANPDIYVTGFSNTHLEGKSELYRLKTTAKGSLISVSSNNFSYTTDTTGGDSGAPMYVINGDVKTVISIHNRGTDDDNQYNHSTRITTDILHFIYNNNNLSY